MEESKGSHDNVYKKRWKQRINGSEEYIISRYGHIMS